MKPRIYAGIGSRETPPDILEMMRNAAIQLSHRNWYLRSGFAGGADTAFYEGASAVSDKYVNYLPWDGFNGAPKNHPNFVVPAIDDEWMKLAESFHPNWAACTWGARNMHCRNLAQILGLDLNTPADMVVCWTPGARGSGGTGQALRIAKHYNIPIFDLGRTENMQALTAFVNSKAEEED